jgi:hypothetical protein
VAGIFYTLDGSDPAADTAHLYLAPFTVSETTTVKFFALDQAGNREEARAQIIRIDAEAPTVAITSPATGATVSGTVQVRVTATDAASGMARVAFYLDGVLQETSTGSGPNFQWSWNTRRATKGVRTITAIATDAAGNSSSAEITVTVS